MMHLSVADVLLIAVPLIIFVLGSAGSGIVMLIRFTSTLARGEKTQEAIAESNDEIRTMLKQYVVQTDKTLANHGERIAVLEYATNTESWRTKETWHTTTSLRPEAD